jgi:hypothetical protein
MGDKPKSITDLIGRTLVCAAGVEGGEEMVFVTDDGWKFVFYHAQDCCKTVDIADIHGDLADLVGSPIVTADQRTSELTTGKRDDSETWTFYEFATAKGNVTVRWVGSSNGYYSESVYLRVVRDREAA